MIDASIPLQVKPPQIEDPLAAYGKILQIKGAQQQQEANAQRIQEGALDLQQKQRAVDYQKTFTDSLKKNTSRNDDGTIATDWGKLQGDLTNAGYGPEALSLSTERAKIQKAGLDLVEAQHKVDGERVKAVGQQLGALPQVDESATPDVQQVQKAAFNAAAPTAIANLVRAGHLPQAEGARMIQTLQQSGGWTPQVGAWVKQNQMAALSADQQVAHIQQGITAAREGRVADANVGHLEAETTKANAEMADKAKSDLAAQLSQAKNPLDYERIRLADKNRSLRDSFPDSKNLDFSPDKLADTQESILTHGMNATQLDTHQAKKDAQATRDFQAQSLDEARKSNEALRRDSLDLRKSMLEGQPTVAQRQAAAKLDFNQKALGPLSKQAGQLATALKDGTPLSVTSYVSPSGAEMTMEEHLKGKADDPNARQDAVNDMTARLNATKSQMKNITSASHNIMDHFNADRSVSREDALASIDNIGPKPKADATTKAGPAAAPASQPAATKPAALAKQQWKDPGGHTWEQDQEVYGPGGKKYIVTGFRDGKVLTKPAQ